MNKIIVNADDYGMDENRTRAILRSFRMGVVTATTAMVNMPWFDRAVEMAKGTSLYDNIGLHLTLTEGLPLTDPIKKCVRFCDSNGRFNAEFHHRTMSRLFLTKEERVAVAVEAEAQMMKFISSGLPLRHLDSHHHSHTDWAITQIVLPIAKRMGFVSVRRSRDLNNKCSFSKYIYKLLVNHYMGGLIGFSTNGFGAVDDLARHREGWPNKSVVEIMVHPLYRNDKELTLGGGLYNGLKGTQTMDEVLGFLKSLKNNFTVINYQGI